MFKDKHAKAAEELQTLTDLVAPKSQYANYRKVLKELKPPAIPFLGVYLTDLTFIDLGNPDYLPESHFINMDKRRKVHAVIKEIQLYQMNPFKFEENVEDMEHHWEGQALGDNALYERSLIVEPREDEDD